MRRQSWELNTLSYSSSCHGLVKTQAFSGGEGKVQNQIPYCKKKVDRWIVTLLLASSIPCTPLLGLTAHYLRQKPPRKCWPNQPEIWLLALPLSPRDSPPSFSYCEDSGRAPIRLQVFVLQ